MYALYCEHRRLDSVISCVLFFVFVFFFSPSLKESVWVSSELYIFQCLVQYLKIAPGIQLEDSKPVFLRLVIAMS